MTNAQLYVAIGVPLLVNTIALVAFYVLLGHRIDSVDTRVDSTSASLRAEMSARFDAVNQRFDDLRDLWRAELKRVEEVLDARLKHLEETRR